MVGLAEVKRKELKDEDEELKKKVWPFYIRSIDEPYIGELRKKKQQQQRRRNLQDFDGKRRKMSSVSSHTASECLNIIFQSRLVFV